MRSMQLSAGFPSARGGLIWSRFCAQARAAGIWETGGGRPPGRKLQL